MRRLMIPVLLLIDGHWSDCREGVSVSILVGRPIPSNGTDGYFPHPPHQSLVLVPFFLILEVFLTLLLSKICWFTSAEVNSGSISCRATSCWFDSVTTRRMPPCSSDSI